MINRVRIGIWETNSSTMNQIAIYRHSKDPNKLDKSVKHVILTGDVPDCDDPVFTNDTTFDTETKIQILYSMIREIKNYENDPYFNGKGRNEYPDWERYLNNLLAILDRNGVTYEFKIPITEDCRMDDDTFGMSGIENMDFLFLNKYALQSFIFNPRSGFTFGEENMYPSVHKVGYTNIPTGDNYIAIII